MGKSSKSKKSSKKKEKKSKEVDDKKEKEKDAKSSSKNKKSSKSKKDKKADKIISDSENTPILEQQKEGGIGSPSAPSVQVETAVDSDSDDDDFMTENQKIPSPSATFDSKKRAASSSNEAAPNKSTTGKEKEGVDSNDDKDAMTSPVKKPETTAVLSSPKKKGEAEASSKIKKTAVENIGSTTNPTSPATHGTTSLVLPPKNGSTGRYMFLHNNNPVYEWDQTSDKCRIFLKPPPDMAQYIQVEITKNEVKVGIEGGKAWFLDKFTFGSVDPEKSNWNLDTDWACITLHKETAGSLWPTALHSGGTANTINKKIDSTVQEQLQDDMRKFEHAYQTELDQKKKKKKKKPQSKETATKKSQNSVDNDSLTLPNKNESTGRYMFLHNNIPIFEWDQTSEKCRIFIQPPNNMARHAKVEISENELKVGMQRGKAWFLDERTFGAVDPKESTWKVEKDWVCISMHKTSSGSLWARALLSKNIASTSLKNLDPKVQQQLQEDMEQNDKAYQQGMVEQEKEEQQQQERFKATWKQREDLFHSASQKAIAQERMKQQRSSKNTPPTIPTIPETEETTTPAVSSPKETSSTFTITNNLQPLTQIEKDRILARAEEYLTADIRLFSACQDDQKATDNSNIVKTIGFRKSKRSSQVQTDYGGVCTSVLLKFLYEHHNQHSLTDESSEKEEAPEDGSPEQKKEEQGVFTYSSLLKSMRQELVDRGYHQQAPVLTSSRHLSMEDEFKIIPKHFSGKRHALIIGINYHPSTPFFIPGCQNDAWNTIKYLKQCQGFTESDMYILMDNDQHTPPTRENILKAFHRFAFGIQPGDAAFFYYAGHGNSKVSEGMDDDSACFDQVMMPMDFMTNGGIVDDEIFRVLLVPMGNVQVTAIVDCCHSGSIFDLPFEFVQDDDGENEMDFRTVRFPHMDLVRHERKRIEAITKARKGDRPSVIERIMIKPPTKKTKKNMKSPSHQHSYGDDDSNEKETTKYMKFAAVDNPEDVQRQRKADEKELFWIGCALLCLNPIKLFRVLWS